MSIMSSRVLVFGTCPLDHSCEDKDGPLRARHHMVVQELCQRTKVAHGTTKHEYGNIIASLIQRSTTFSIKMSAGVEKEEDSFYAGVRVYQNDHSFLNHEKFGHD